MAFFDRLLNFDRLFNNLMKGSEKTAPIKPRNPKQEKPEAFFLDADSSSSMGNVDYMRESKTIRRTFPGTANSPGTKERVIEVDAETQQLTRRTEGLGGQVQQEMSQSVTGGVPKPVKKTFAEKLSTTEMKQRLKGSAVSGVNTPMTANAAPVARKEALKPKEAPTSNTSSSIRSSAPGSIDPFRDMVKDLNS